MLLTQQLEEMALPHAEESVVRTLLDKGSALRGASTRQIAAAAYTTPATLVRLGQRLGYEGWADFFEAFLQERDYLDRHFQKIDANRPFDAGDSQTVIANKIATLHQESIQDSMALLDYAQLQKAVSLLLAARNIFLVGVSVSLDCTLLFKRKMQRLGKTVLMESNQGELLFLLLSAAPQDCAIVVSYSGTTKRIVDSVEILHQNGVPTILITGLGQNPLLEKVDCVLHMTTRERLSSKIGNFTTEVSAQLLLDILYGCYFAKDYRTNWENRLRMTRQAELYRHSDNQIMKE